jgi:hypothetical protein
LAQLHFAVTADDSLATDGHTRHFRGIGVAQAYEQGAAAQCWQGISVSKPFGIGKGICIEARMESMNEKIRVVIPFPTSFQNGDDRQTLNDAYRHVGRALLDGNFDVAQKEIERGFKIIDDPTSDLNAGDRLWWGNKFREFQNTLARSVAFYR